MLKGVLAAFSPSGNQIAILKGDGNVKIWAKDKGCTELCPDDKQEWSALAWGLVTKEDTKRKKRSLLVLGAKSGTLLAWDHIKAEIKWTNSSCNSGPVDCMCFTQNPEALYIGSFDGTVKELDPRSGQLRQEFSVGRHAVSSIAVSPNGAMLLISTADELKLYNLENKKKIRRRKGTCVNRVAFSGDGRYALSAGASGVSIWKSETFEKEMDLSMEHPAVALDVSEKSATHMRVLAVSVVGEAYVWSGATAEDLGKTPAVRILVRSKSSSKRCTILARFSDSTLVALVRGTVRRPVFDCLDVEGLSGTVVLGATKDRDVSETSLCQDTDVRGEFASKKRPASKEPEQPDDSKERAKDGQARKKARKNVSFGEVTVLGDEKNVESSVHTSKEPEAARDTSVDGYKYRWFSKEEDEIIREAAYSAIQLQGWNTEEGLEKLLGYVKCNKEEAKKLKECRKAIVASVPYRKPHSVTCRARLILNVFVQRGKWSKEEVDLLKKSMEEHGRNWTKLSLILGRSQTDVRNKWRYNRNQKRRGRWTLDEIEKLCKLVHQNIALNQKSGVVHPKTQILGLNWTAIGDALGTRPDTHCMRHWYDHLSSRKIKIREWEVEDDHKLLLSLLESGVPDEDYIEWDMLLPHRSKEACQERWGEMVRALGPRYRDQPFETKLELLAKRYAPCILEDECELYN